MTETNRSDSGALPLSVERRVDQICRRFEAAWRALAGPRPCIGDYINDVTGPGRLALLRELLCLDVEYRREAGEEPAPEDYLSQFPDQAELIHAALRQPKGEPGRPGSAPEPRPDVPGYEVLECIGCGGMGVVWRCYDHVLHGDLAMKVLKEKYRDDPNFADFCRRFQREARVLGGLQHPGIVPIHQSGTLPDGRPFFVMRLVKGRTLAQLLVEQGPGAARLLGVFGAVCQAVAYAHSEDVIHRDLKLANVMVGAFGEVQLMDMGLAKVLPSSSIHGVGPRAVCPTSSETPGDVTQMYVILDESDGHTVPGSVMGTWEFMPPEQARGLADKADRRSDVFGLGAMLCAILTGKPPYVGDPKEEVKRQAREADLTGAYARLETCGADADLIKLAKHCLAKKPGDRPQHAGEVAAAVAAHMANVEERLRKAQLARQRMRWLAVGLASTLLGLATTGLLAWQAQDAKLRRLDAEQGRLEAELAREAEKRQHAIDRALTAAMGADLEGADQAIAEAEQAGASPGQLHMRRGQIALHRGQSREAREHLEEAVRLQSKSVAARGMLAAAYAYDGHWERYDQMIREMEQLTPSTPEDFLFKGYAEAYLEPERGLQTIQQAFESRPMMNIALLLRAEVRAFVAQDTDNIQEAEWAVLDAKYAKELLHDNPTALWVSLEAHLAKAGVHEHRSEMDQHRAELELAGKDADALKRYTALPEAVVYRWTYFREVGREEEVLDELRRASKDTDHVSVNFCCALALYRRGKPGDFEEALRVLGRTPRSYNDRLLPFVLAEHDYPDKQDWPARARKACEAYAAWAQDGLAIMDTQTVLCLLGKKGDAVDASKALLKGQDLFYTLRREPILGCACYNAGELSADELLRLAGRSQYDQCLAHYYVAMTMLAEGDRNGAREHFDKAVKTRAWGWSEYDMSWVFRDRLEDPTWPPWISKKQRD
jgi:serine/threonine protein kinase